MVNADFRAAFPEFSDVARYPDAMLNFWSVLATAQVDPCRWGTQTNVGIYLYVAHEITMAAQNFNTGAIGGVPGSSSPGAIGSKTIGSVSVTYDTTSSSEKDGGWWNGTSYGRQFLRLARIFGSGVVQL